MTGTLTGAFEQTSGVCEAGKGPEIPYRLELTQRARVRVTVSAPDFSPVVHARASCTDEQSEVGCADTGGRPNESTFASVLDPGAYTVFADSSEKGSRGAYTIEAELVPEAGRGVRGDACADAVPLGLDEKPIEGDTFDAKDDFRGRCSAAGAPDTMYRFELTARSRVTGRFLFEEGGHAFVLSRSCTDRATELACGTTLDEILPPGAYALAIDGAAAAGAKGAFGRYTFALRAKDVSQQEAACRTPATIALGQTVHGTTASAGDRFLASCAGREDAQASGDRVYKLTLGARTHVQLLLSTPGHDGVLVLRRSCTDLPPPKAIRTNEAACNNDSPDNRHSKIDTTLDPGTYFVVVDGHQGKNEGVFTLEAKLVK